MDSPSIVFYTDHVDLCRELILNHNLLRVLPFEIGKLFHLHSLGLHGNPLNKDVMSLYSEPSGTVKLLSYMLDNLSGEWWTKRFGVELFGSP